ncbi:MAG TPA: hypothetical protein VGE13_04070 [Candidatus Saccharimonadales bacterium]
MSVCHVSPVMNEVVHAIIDGSTDRGETPPGVVLSELNNLCVGLGMARDALPRELRNLRDDARQRERDGSSGFRVDALCDLLVMYGPWATRA